MIATHKGEISGPAQAGRLTVDRSFHTASSAEADAVVVAGGAGLADDPAAITYVQSAYRHHKPLAAWGDGAELLTAAGIATDDPGVVTRRARHQDLRQGRCSTAMAVHRHWERAGVHPTRQPWPGGVSMPNGIDLILADHRAVDVAVRRVRRDADGAVIGQIVDMLTAHDDAEHGALYPFAADLLGDADAPRPVLAAHTRRSRSRSTT